MGNELFELLESGVMLFFCALAIMTLSALYVKVVR